MHFLQGESCECVVDVVVLPCGVDNGVGLKKAAMSPIDNDGIALSVTQLEVFSLRLDFSLLTLHFRHLVKMRSSYRRLQGTAIGGSQ